MSLLFFLALQGIEHTKDSVDVLKAALARKEAVLLDVRESSEWEDGHLDSARSLPLSLLKTLAPEEVEGKVSKQVVVYLHCRSGGRALTAAGILKKLGYDVKPLKPGYQALKDAGVK